MIINKKLLIISMLSSFFVSYGQITFTSKPLDGGGWEAESLFVGEGFYVLDSTKDVVVKWKRYSKFTQYIGGIWVLHANYPDTGKFVFHNFIKKFIGEDSIVNLGEFKAGDELVFKYCITDTTVYPKDYYYNKKLYSGQNRQGVDKYISERTAMFGNRFLVAGRIDSNRIEAGFDDFNDFHFQAIVFEVSNVFLSVQEKRKVPAPIISPKSGQIGNISTIVSIIVPHSGDFKVVRSDTTWYMPRVPDFTIYYTTDSSNPRTSTTRKLYTQPLSISTYTVLKTYAVFESDTNCFASEVVTATYTKDVSSVKNGFRLNGIAPNTIADFAIYSISGQLLRTMTASASNVVSYTQTLPSGIYFLRSKVDGQVRRVVTGR